ncbi:MAG TPA: lipocalin-like domain-containing protein [Steroidobacteraceae bacterium]|nr:lipocalin-like domain-containing protein [Steroidobacteraceae bacterium]HNS27915.1 lipocalin-like domain-containing protein [Steroidobacteraceae bacterium]
MRAALPGLFAVAMAAAMSATVAGSPVPAASALVQPAPVVPGLVMAFPRDHGSHPAFRTEWWYATGWLRTDSGEDLGFQITFFRSLQPAAATNPSAFAPRQILIAHAAISDAGRGRLWKDERVARAGFGLAEAREGDAAVWIDDWRLERVAETFAVHAPARDFGLELALRERQPPLLNGEAGFSRKGAAPLAASYYYSLPQLEVRGHVVREGRRVAVTGTAWLDHEWSSEVLEPGAVGWDWFSVNLADGGALMAFRIRDRDGRQRWAGGTLRAADGSSRHYAPEEIEFIPGREWRSPRTAISYPVQWSVRVGERRLTLEPLMDDQESDTRLTTGAIYWEGAVRVREDARLLGLGYLELTGYGGALELR